jgi:hypothetical protein
MAASTRAGTRCSVTRWVAPRASIALTGIFSACYDEIDRRLDRDGRSDNERDECESKNPSEAWASRNLVPYSPVSRHR